MTIKILFFYFAIFGTAFALDYSKCTDLVHENRINYEVKNCSITLCFIQFSCDFGAGPILMNAACKVTGRSNSCPSIQECINDRTVEFKELDRVQPLDNLKNPSSEKGVRVIGL